VLKRSGVGAEKAMAEQPRKGSLKVSGLLSAAAIIKLSGKRILTVATVDAPEPGRRPERVFTAALGGGAAAAELEVRKRQPPSRRVPARSRQLSVRRKSNANPRMTSSWT
jgi:hypothetical protein